MMAPILAFTSEESLWIPVPGGGKRAFAGIGPRFRVEWRQPELAAEWQALLALRGDVMRALEDARQAKKAIGQSLEARVVGAARTILLCAACWLRRKPCWPIFSSPVKPRFRLARRQLEFLWVIPRM